MNVQQVHPKTTLTHLQDLTPGTVFELEGAFWIITDFEAQGEVQVVNVLNGKCRRYSLMATVVPLYIGFVPSKPYK